MEIRGEDRGGGMKNDLKGDKGEREVGKMEYWRGR